MVFAIGNLGDQKIETQARRFGCGQKKLTSPPKPKSKKERDREGKRSQIRGPVKRKNGWGSPICGPWNSNVSNKRGMGRKKTGDV